MTIEDQIREKARALLAEGRVQCVVGYERGTDGRQARPAFVERAEEADRLVFDATCTHTLVKYLLDRKTRPTAVVVKPCDARALNVLLSERQVKRENVFAIGVACAGVRERSPFGAVGDALAARCLECEERVPVVSDFLAGEPPAVAAQSTARQEQMERLARMTAREKAAFWEGEFSRCLRCYACRQVCPGCYCAECFVEQQDPEWVGIRIGAAESQIFHTIRVFHLAGRCVGCDECERVCPVHIPLSLLSQRLEGEMEAMFGCPAGSDGDSPAPLFTFRPEDRLGVG